MADEELLPQVTLLVDQDKWIQPLLSALEHKARVTVVNLTTFEWVITDPFPDHWGVVVNRVSARPDHGSCPAGWLTFGRDLLTSLELERRSVVNGRFTYQVGASKALQGVVFQKCGVLTPRTIFLPGGCWEEKGNKGGERVIIKPNSGGYGKGISGCGSGVDLKLLFEMDGAAVQQVQIVSGDGKIHRLEMLGGEPLYLASSPLQTGEFNYCLSQSGREVTLSCADYPPTALEGAKKVVNCVGMDIGSVEFLLDDKGEPWFIDINPVSSYHPEVEERLGFDPWVRQAEWIRDREEHKK